MIPFSRPDTETPAFDAALEPPRTGRFAVASDFQRTSRVEVWRESNLEERAIILEAIAREQPELLLLLGDLVFCGSSAAEWKEFDALTAPIREAGIPVLAVPGNHEYWVSPRAGLRNFQARFPLLEGRRWHALTWGPLELLMLDSNRSFLTSALWEEQATWYAEEIDRADGDAEVRGTLVLLHHPPYTNSSVTSDELHVQRFFVPPFQAARKTLAMLSGHVHSYERYERGGKTFLVTGGGGGPRIRLETGHRQRHRDDLFAGPAVRFFHFLLATLTPGGIEFEMRGLRKGERVFETMDRFRLPWPGEEKPG
ncbi:MAG TPA: metallophosphoesterase [Thermoanaerobaculia bacterium]|nr:metallophosphoesterase [Thermoanaerobaculia bacterium]